jgi:hypothetical protein
MFWFSISHAFLTSCAPSYLLFKFFYILQEWHLYDFWANGYSFVPRRRKIDYIAWSDLCKPIFSIRPIIQDQGVSEDQFLDVGILVSFDHSPPFPPTVHEQALKATVDIVRYYTQYSRFFSDDPAAKTIQFADQLRSYTGDDEILVDSFNWGNRFAVAVGHHHPLLSMGIWIITLELRISHKICKRYLRIGCLMKSTFYLSRGPQVLVWLTTGQIVENPPLDNGETNEYKQFVKEVIIQQSGSNY